LIRGNSFFVKKIVRIEAGVFTTVSRQFISVKYVHQSHIVRLNILLNIVVGSLLILFLFKHSKM